VPDENPPANTDPADLAAASTEDAGTAAPWGDDFDAARAWKLIENLRADNAKTKAKLSDYDKAEQARADAEKTELQRAVERAERAEKSLSDRDAADRRKTVLSKHGLSDEDAVFLAGVADDDLDAKAEALAKRLGVGARKDAAEDIPGKRE
jgi:hypothetical protein